MTETSMSVPVLLPSRLVQIARARLHEMASDFRRLGVECESILLQGVPEEEIAVLVKSRSVDRVIVAIRSATGVARLIGASVGEELISGLDVPVCTIGRRMNPEAVRDTQPGRVLLATSLHPGSFVVAEFASALAEANHSPLNMLHVLEGHGMSIPQRDLTRVMAQDRLSALAANPASHGASIVFSIHEGDPATIILRKAGLMPQDLIILGAPHRSRVSWFLGTSVVHRVVAEARCPVITIRPTIALASGEMRETLDADVQLAHS
jgi:nucleotide-binding universal stress UspA family protein